MDYPIRVTGGGKDYVTFSETLSSGRFDRDGNKKFFLAIIEGSCCGQVRLIESNTEHKITLKQEWDKFPVSSGFQIYEEVGQSRTFPEFTYFDLSNRDVDSNGKWKPMRELGDTCLFAFRNTGTVTANFHMGKDGDGLVGEIARAVESPVAFYIVDKSEATVGQDVNTRWSSSTRVKVVMVYSSRGSVFLKDRPF